MDASVVLHTSTFVLPLALSALLYDNGRVSIVEVLSPLALATVLGSGATIPIAQMKSAKKEKSDKSSSKKCAVDPDVVKKIEEAYAKLNGPEGVKCHSLLKKHLTKDVVDKLKWKKTTLGATLYDCIRSGVFNLDASWCVRP
ncbi:Protein W10C8.5 [Aphelenchoides avenae]|nr:Protein W10C8.5 [Aphelenchus avenae]